MKSGLRRIANAVGARPPVAYTGKTSAGSQIFNLSGSGAANNATYLRQYKQNSTIYAIVSLLQGSAARPKWHLYKSVPQDGRRRYSTEDQGSDQRPEILKHAAIQLWNKPNAFATGFEFREGSNQHQELTGETWWVLDRENAANFPTSMWYVTPSRMEPVPDPDQYILGYIYTAPSGEKVPLQLDEVILEKIPDPEDPYRGCGPVAPLLPNVQQMRYATEYQRNLFLNNAEPSGTISVPNSLTDNEFRELLTRWRESHQGYTRAGRVGVLENGNVYTPNTINNRDLEYANLRLNARDEIREAWLMHKAMLGTTEEVNRANAETAKEIFNNDLIVPRLDRRRETLNYKLLPTFGQTGVGVEFDYDPPVSLDREQDNAELTTKSQAAQRLVDAGFDPDDVLEAVGLPKMYFVGVSAPNVNAAPSEEEVLPSPQRRAITIPNTTEDAGLGDLGNYMKHLIGINGHEYERSKR